MKESVVFKAGTAIVGALALATLASSVLVPENSSAASASTKINVVVDPTISVAVSSANINIDLTPSASGTFGNGSTDVTVKTNGAAGYKAYITTNTTETSLVSTYNSTTYKINPLASSVAKASFTTNSWGYSTNDSTYAGIPAANATSALVSSATAPANDTTKVYVGAKVDNNQASGNYSNTVVFTAIAN